MGPEVFRGFQDHKANGSDVHRTMRFPPVLQFVRVADPLIEQKLRIFVEQIHRKQLRADRICEMLYDYARSLGYNVMFSAHEVESENVFFSRGDVIKSALILVDLEKIEPAEGYHVGRLARDHASGSSVGSRQSITHDTLRPSGANRGFVSFERRGGPIQ